MLLTNSICVEFAISKARSFDNKKDYYEIVVVVVGYIRISDIFWSK